MHFTALLPLLTGAPTYLPGTKSEPYLQLTPNPNQRLIQWVSEKSAKSNLTASWGKATSLPPITLVTPGLEVRRAVVATRSRDPLKYILTSNGTSRSYTAAGLPGSSVKIILFGDSGRGLPGQRLIGARLEKTPADLIVHTGDIVYPTGREQDYFKFHFPVYGAKFATLPSVAAPGNHDTAYRDLKRWPDGLAYYKLWNVFNSPPGVFKDRGNFSFTFGPTFWIILDSNPYNGWNGTKARTWLSKELLKGSKFRYKFVAFHHPPYHSSDKKKTETHMRAIAPLLEAAGITAVFNGHVHNYQRTKPIGKGGRGPVYIVTGAGGAELYDQKIAKDKKLWQPFTAQYLTGYSFTRLSVGPSGASVEQIDTQGNVIDRASL
jgi:acid phosphatase type 7